MVKTIYLGFVILIICCTSSSSGKNKFSDGKSQPPFKNDPDTVYITSGWRSADTLKERFKERRGTYGSWYDEVNQANIKYEFESLDTYAKWLFSTYGSFKTKVCGFVARKNGVLYGFMDVTYLIRFAKADSSKLKHYPRFHPYKISEYPGMLENVELAREHLNHFRNNPLEVLNKLEEYYKANPIHNDNSDDDDDNDLLEDDTEDEIVVKPLKPSAPKKDERITNLRAFRNSINPKTKLPKLEYSLALSYSSEDMVLEISKKGQSGKNIKEMALSELLVETDGSRLEDRVRRYGKGKVLEIYFPASHDQGKLESKYAEIQKSPFYGYMERVFLNNPQATTKDLREILNPNLRFVGVTCFPGPSAEGSCVLHLGYKDFRENSYRDLEEIHNL